MAPRTKSRNPVAAIAVAALLGFGAWGLSSHDDQDSHKLEIRLTWLKDDIPDADAKGALSIKYTYRGNVEYLAPPYRPTVSHSWGPKANQYKITFLYLVANDYDAQSPVKLEARAKDNAGAYLSGSILVDGNAVASNSGKGHLQVDFP